jgi:hypothetical protein
MTSSKSSAEPSINDIKSILVNISFQQKIWILFLEQPMRFVSIFPRPISSGTYLLTVS